LPAVARVPERVERAVAKHLVNPVLRAMLLLGVAPRAFALLETTGRRTGRRRRTPVGNGLDGDVFWVVSEHGERSAYVRNLIADPRVRVKVGLRWRSGRASLVTGDDGLARRHELDRRNGLGGRLDGAIFRALASEVATVRIELD
jgi:deazaflavin-dependent oxidoreductase (nitroreductase family)